MKIQFIGTPENHNLAGEVYQFLLNDNKTTLFVNDTDMGYAAVVKLDILYSMVQMQNGYDIDKYIPRMVKAIPEEQYLKDLLNGHKVALFIREKGLR